MILSALWVRQNNIKSGKTTVGELTKNVNTKLPWCAESTDRCGGHLKTCSGAENYEVTFMDFSFCSIWNHEAETGQNRLRETQHCRISSALLRGSAQCSSSHSRSLQLFTTQWYSSCRALHWLSAQPVPGIKIYSLSWNRITVTLISI